MRLVGSWKGSGHFGEEKTGMEQILKRFLTTPPSPDLFRFKKHTLL
jgi:hypothetical protein